MEFPRHDSGVGDAEQKSDAAPSQKGSRIQGLFMYRQCSVSLFCCVPADLNSVSPNTIHDHKQKSGAAGVHFKVTSIEAGSLPAGD